MDAAPVAEGAALIVGMDVGEGAEDGPWSLGAVGLVCIAAFGCPSFECL